jgi:hypothetical protein
MICHTDTHSNERRQPTPTAVGNGLPHTPNVPLSCTDRRYYSVNLRLFSRRDLNGSPFGSTPANGNTKSNRSHGGSSGRIPTAPQVLLRAAGARTTICFEGNSSNRNSNRFWGRRGSQNTGEDCRSIGASCAGRVEEAKAPFTAPAPVIDQESRLGAVPSFLNGSHAAIFLNGSHAGGSVTPLAVMRQITTENIGDGSGSRSEVQLRAFATRVHDKLSGFLGYYANARSERCAYARSGTSADTGADLQPRSGGRSAPHSQEAVIALLAFGTVAAAYVWLAYAACVP